MFRDPCFQSRPMIDTLNARHTLRFAKCCWTGHDESRKRQGCASFLRAGKLSMKKRIPLAIATIGASVLTTVVVTAGPAGASVFEMVGWSGGSIVGAGH